MDQGYRASLMMGLMLKSENVELLKWAPILKLYIQEKSNHNFGKEIYFRRLSDLAKQLLEIDSIPQPVRRMALISVADFKAIKGDSATAHKMYAIANKIGRGDPSIYFKQAQIHHEDKDYQKGIDAYMKYADILGFDSEICRLISTAYYQMGDHNKARIFAKKGVGLNSKNMEMVVRYGLLAKIGERENVLKMIDDSPIAEKVLFALVKTAKAEKNKTVWQWYLNKYKEKYKYERDRIRLLE